MKNIINQFLDIAFPPVCLICRQAIASAHTLCSDCWGKIEFCTHPFCDKCGTPMAFHTNQEHHCASCIQTPPRFSKARTALLYNDTARYLITSFKYRDKWFALPLFAKWLAQAGSDLFEQCDYLIPVPLHRRRLIQRRFNQAGLLARQLSKEVHIPVLLDGLHKIKATPPQTSLTGKQRKANLTSAFAVNVRYIPQLQGKSVILLDDVRTTGSTVEACTKTLLAAGCEDVTILTLALAHGVKS